MCWTWIWANVHVRMTAAMGGSYEFAKCASANLRKKDDAYNPAIGGLFAGSMLGLKCKLPTPTGFIGALGGDTNE